MFRIPAAFHRLAVLLALLLGVATLAPPATASGSTAAATARAISITATPAVAPVRSVVVFTGTLTRSPLRSAVQLQRKVGARWVKVASAATRTKAGAYRVTAVAPAAVGVYSFRTFAPAKGSLRAATSRVVRVTALRKVVVAAKATPTKVPAGTSSRISGTVRPFVAGTKVVIQKQVGATWTGVGTTTVSSKGGYFKDVPTVASTTYRAAVARAGKNAPGFSIGVRVDTTPVISTSTLPDATQSVGYSFKVAAVGNQSGTWSASGLPTGLSIASNGTIAGVTVVNTGDYPVTLNFVRTGGAVAPGKVVNLKVKAPPAPVISTSTLPDGVKGSPYSHTLTVTASGSPDGTWTAAPLPAGLSVNTDTGAITGTPTATGATDVVIGFTQTSTGQAAPGKTLTLTVNLPPPPVILTDHLPDGAMLSPYSAQVFASGNPAGTWSASGLPAGISINATTGVISGTTLIPGTATVTVNFTQTSSGLAAAPKVLALKIGTLGAETDPTLVSAGGQFSCRIDKAQKLWCWGYDDSGQLGNGGVLDVDPPGVVTPTQVGTAADWTSITTNRGLLTERHACGTRGATAWCWGSNKSGELGNNGSGSSTEPVQVAGAHSWAQLSAGDTSSCGVTTSGAMYCWGDNGLGQLGGPGPDQDSPERVGVDNTWSQVSVGFNHGCAVKGTGTLWCWGSNFRGQLGTGNTTASATPVQVGSDTTWTEVSVGSGYTCATRSAGTLWCWGYGEAGNLGHGGPADETTPRQVGVATNWSSVAAGDATTCAVNTAGETWCWGRNLNGQVGDNSTTVRTAPVQVGTATDWSQLSVGYQHTCGVKADDEVWCWGGNSKGELGSTPFPAGTLVPRKVVG